MKVRLAPSLLTLGLLLVASLANAQAVASGYGLNITQSDSHTTSSGNTLNVSSGATTGGTDTHSATVQLLATVTYTGDTPPSSVTVTYRLTNQANGDVTLGGMKPPSGTGTGYASVQNLIGNTGTVSRGTNEVNAYAHAGPANQDKSATVSVTHGWTNNNDGTYTTWVVLETETLTTRAHIDALPTSGANAARPADGGPIITTPAYPDDNASGFAGQTIKAVTP